MNWAPAIKWGVIGGLVAVILTLLLYFVSPTSLASMSLAFVFLFISLFFLIWGGIEFRKENNNNVSYLQALAATIIIALISTFISSVFSYILMNFIDPQLPQIIQEKVIENAVAMMEKFNTPDDKIDEAIDSMREQGFGTGFKSYALKYVNTMVVYFVFSLIVAAFIKRNTSNLKQPE